ncbi:hypothetical protein R0131_05115 [Clostridium sp. AL.422]|uniref:hypothetical protein n=1 Tax=Clostridium TaxID=1485 RepID=UPI00293DE5EA|nr:MULTISPECIES: hypothetical protein [unclassified Clostridium]MDV4150213.1 hypothetical protein [Clostridium sp. AL.422]
MRKDLFFLVFKTYLKRMTRDLLGLFIFTVLPIIIIFILSSVYKNNSPQVQYVNGFNMTTTYLSVGMMLMFQLNSGLYVINYLNYDLEKSMKWRLQAGPYPKYGFAFSCLMASLIFNYIQGLLIVLFTSIFMKAYWGNIFVTLFVILLISLISQLMNIVVFFIVKKIGVAESLSWFLAWIMAVLGGLMFELPKNDFFYFMQKYGTPFSLGKTAIASSGFIESSTSDLLIALGALILIVILLMYLVIIMGKRKLV